MAPQRCPRPNPQNLPWQKGLDRFAYVKDLEMGESVLDDLGGLNVITQVLKEGGKSVRVIKGNDRKTG